METNNASFFAYPDNKVIGVLNDRSAVMSAIDDLRAAGMPADEIELMHGQKAKEQIDADGDQHGVFGVTLRFFQNLLDGEGETSRRYEKELSAGRYLIAVPAPDREAALSIGQILKRHGGYQAYYYMPLAVETILE